MAFLSNKRRLNGLIKLVFGFGLAIFLSWIFLSPPAPPKNPEYKYMHCKSCQYEKTYDARTLSSKCTKCKEASFKATERPLADTGTAPWKWFYIAISIEAVAFLALLFFVLKPREEDEEEVYLYTDCPHCKRRLRYREALAGRGGMCPRCRRVVRFPGTSDEQDARPAAAES